MADDKDKVVLTDEPAADQNASIEDEKLQAPDETRLNIRFSVTSEGLVDLLFDSKIHRLTIAPEFAMQLSQALFQCAKKASAVRSPIIVPGLVGPGSGTN